VAAERGAVPFETASWARRVLALCIDWFVCTLIVIGFVGLDRYSEIASSAQWYILVVYVVQSAVLTFLAGGSFGKLCTRLRVVPADGRMMFINPLKILARQVAIVLVIPPLIFKADGRGLHDMMAGTSTVTLDTFKDLVARMP
jgi:uncharacterized RDD family membrane protein YckC